MGPPGTKDTPIEIKAFHYWATDGTMISSVYFYSQWLNATDNSTYVMVKLLLIHLILFVRTSILKAGRGRSPNITKQQISHAHQDYKIYNN